MLCIVILYYPGFCIGRLTNMFKKIYGTYDWGDILPVVEKCRKLTLSESFCTQAHERKLQCLLSNRTHSATTPYDDVSTQARGLPRQRRLDGPRSSPATLDCLLARGRCLITGPENTKIRREKDIIIVSVQFFATSISCFIKKWDFL